MKRLIPLLAAAALGAAVLLRPAPPPTAAATGWSAADTSAEPGRRGRRTPPPQHAVVYVAGEVARPGVYPVGADARVRDALQQAGGTRPGADLVAVNLAAHVRDGDEIAVPARGTDTGSTGAGGSVIAGDGTVKRHRGGAGSGHRRGHRAGGPRRAGSRGKHKKRSRAADVPPAAEVDINTADADALAAIPGIGDGLAKRIIDFREQNGAFASVDELLDVAGITEHRLDAMIPYVVAR